MRKAIAPFVLALVAVVATGQDRPPASTSPSAADRLAAESLRNAGFSMVHSPAGTPARARRLVALVTFADRLESGHPQTHWMLASIHETQGKLKPAAAATGICLAARPGDHALAVRWLRLTGGTLKDRTQRVAMLRGAIARKDLPDSVRAAAAVELAQFLHASGAKGAAQAYNEALAFDRCNPRAIQGRLALKTDATPVDRIAALTGLLEGNPAATSVAWEAAVLLDGLGLYAQSLEMFEHAWQVARQRGEDISHGFLVDYFNAMLDAGKAGEALEIFAPMQEKFKGSADFLSLLIEAHRARGQNDKADAIVRVMDLSYRMKAPSAAVSLSFATELAWFYQTTLPRPKAALEHARQAASLKPESPLVQRILGVAELTSGQKELTAVGLARLIRIQKKDIYAAVFLAEYYHAARDQSSGKDAILAGASHDHSGPAFRRLLVAAGKQSVTIPAPAHVDEVRARIQAIDRKTLALARSPQSAVEVTLRPLAKSVAVGEGVTVEATLTNRAATRLPLGDWGLFSPVLALQVAVAGGPTGTFTNLPLASWPAPRYLEPGGSVRCTVRLDVGSLAATLAAHPLDDLTLTVSGVLDPVQEGRAFRSSVPSVVVKPVQIARPGLLGAFDRNSANLWRATYQRALGLIVRDVKHGPIPHRMRAVRQIGALLTLARRVELGNAKLPAPLVDVFQKPVLFAMLQAALRDKSDVIRAEMIAALGAVPMENDIVTLVSQGAGVQDPSGLVRFRLVELLGASGLRGQETIIDVLAQDRYDMVRMMAQAFQQQRPGR
jgi:tetratricopeptide (TPR) repeat protein